MKLSVLVGWVLLAVSGCAGSLPDATGRKESMILRVQWQRLVDDEGGTCDRCGGTEEELGKGVQSLKESLKPLDIDVVFEESALSREQCAEDISESNRIWIAGRPIEEWLGAEIGQSECGSCCSKIGAGVECRTMSVEGDTYEVIPARLIVKAGWLAAMQMMEGGPVGRGVPSHQSKERTREACCPSQGKQSESHGECCPEPKKTDS